jgi:hypothetical protein
VLGRGDDLLRVVRRSKGEALLLLSLIEDETEWRRVVLAQEPRRRRNSALMESKTH